MNRCKLKILKRKAEIEVPCLVGDFPEHPLTGCLLLIGFIALRNLMREREAAGNALMGTTEGDGNLSRIPLHAQADSWLVIKVPFSKF